jgi:beta-mannanase
VLSGTAVNLSLHRASARCALAVVLIWTALPARAMPAESTSLPPFSIAVGSATGSVTLSWTRPTENEDGSPLIDLAGYWIYWQNGAHTDHESMKIDNPGLSTIVIDNLVAGTYELAMTSFNVDGVESARSNTITRIVEAGAGEAAGADATTDTTENAADEGEPEVATGAGDTPPFLVISGTPPEAVTAGNLYLFTPGVESSGEDPPVFMIEGTPHWAGFNEINGELYGAPAEEDIGFYDAITISATDGVVETSLPTFSIEVVAPGAAVGAATLSWIPPTENEDGSYLADLAGYWIYWGNNPGTYTEWMRIDNPGLTSILIEDLVPGVWEFAMTSFNADGVESSLSNAVTRIVEESATSSFVDDASGTPPGVVPANPNATLGARQLLQRITDNTSAPRRKVGSGQHLGSFPRGHLSVEPGGHVYELQQLTGQTPWLFGADYDASWEGQGHDYATINAVLIDHYAAGGAITISIHARIPGNEDLRWDDYDSIDIGKLITPGTNEYNGWRKMLDEYAVGLQELQNNDVPVLFRLFHEQNRTKFWWAYRNSTMTAARYNTLWQQTYDYLTNTKGLNNLLWVWAPVCGAGLSVPNTIAYYPGDDYVDVVSCSNYHGNTTTDEDRAEQLALHQALPDKPFAIAEGFKNTEQTEYDNAKLLQELEDNYTYVSYFLCWNDVYALINNPNPGTLLNDPLIDNR